MEYVIFVSIVLIGWVLYFYCSYLRSGRYPGFAKYLDVEVSEGIAIVVYVSYMFLKGAGILTIIYLGGQLVKLFMP